MEIALCKEFLENILNRMYMVKNWSTRQTLTSSNKPQTSKWNFTMAFDSWTVVPAIFFFLWYFCHIICVRVWNVKGTFEYKQLEKNYSYIKDIHCKKSDAPTIQNKFSPTRPSGPSWSRSRNVCLFLSVFLFFFVSLLLCFFVSLRDVPFLCNFFAWSDWCRACLVRGLVRSQSRSRVEP